MKRLVIVLSLALLFLLAACGIQRDAKMKVQSQSQPKPQSQLSAIDTNVPVNKYVVRSNESAGDIAERYHVNIEEFLRLNPDLLQRIGYPNPNNPVDVPKEVVDTPIKKDETVKLPANESMTGYEQQVLALTNQERQKAGLSPCSGNDSNLNRSARAKSEDMATNNYFSHDSPTYGDPFAMMRQFGVQYQSAGENIAMGQPTPQEVVQAWMNSPGHRKNIMNGAFTYMGVGYVVKNGKPYWTQQFIGK